MENYLLASYSAYRPLSLLVSLSFSSYLKKEKLNVHLCFVYVTICFSLYIWALSLSLLNYFIDLLLLCIKKIFWNDFMARSGFGAYTLLIVLFVRAHILVCDCVFVSLNECTWKTSPALSRTNILSHTHPQTQTATKKRQKIQVSCCFIQSLLFQLCSLRCGKCSERKSNRFFNTWTSIAVERVRWNNNTHHWPSAVLLFSFSCGLINEKRLVWYCCCYGRGKKGVWIN